MSTGRNQALATVNLGVAAAVYAGASIIGALLWARSIHSVMMRFTGPAFEFRFPFFVWLYWIGVFVAGIYTLVLPYPVWQTLAGRIRRTGVADVGANPKVNPDAADRVLEEKLAVSRLTFSLVAILFGAVMVIVMAARANCSGDAAGGRFNFTRLCIPEHNTRFDSMGGLFGEFFKGEIANFGTGKLRNFRFFYMLQTIATTFIVTYGLSGLLTVLSL